MSEITSSYLLGLCASSVCGITCIFKQPVTPLIDFNSDQRTLIRKQGYKSSSGNKCVKCIYSYKISSDKHQLQFNQQREAAHRAAAAFPLASASPAAAAASSSAFGCSLDFMSFWRRNDTYTNTDLESGRFPMASMSPTSRSLSQLA